MQQLQTWQHCETFQGYTCQI